MSTNETTGGASTPAAATVAMTRAVRHLHSGHLAGIGDAGTPNRGGPGPRRVGAAA